MKINDIIISKVASHSTVLCHVFIPGISFENFVYESFEVSRIARRQWRRHTSAKKCLWLQRNKIRNRKVREAEAEAEAGEQEVRLDLRI